MCPEPKGLRIQKKVWIRVLLTAEMHRKTFLFTCLVLCRAKGQHNIYLENGNTNCQAILCTIACHQAYALNGQTLVWYGVFFRPLLLALFALWRRNLEIVLPFNGNCYYCYTTLYHCPFPRHYNTLINKQA